MASIVENKKYGENHKVQLKDKPTNVEKCFVKKKSIDLGKNYIFNYT